MRNFGAIGFVFVNDKFIGIQVRRANSTNTFPARIQYLNITRVQRKSFAGSAVSNQSQIKIEWPIKVFAPKHMLPITEIIEDYIKLEQPFCV
ncbi:hypothetical protein KR100_13060 [Synechococcus sp. KORDI-100]|nr:hypothetical protein KR100_13060 [Synechococcus sp. KORDI-100]